MNGEQNNFIYLIKKNKKKYFFILLKLNFLILLLIIYGISIWNNIQLYPSENEIKLLNQFYGDVSIYDSKDILKIQNLTVKKIRHEFLNDNEILIDEIIKKEKGFCYDRSILLQKILLKNNIEIRPVYLFFNIDKENPWFNFFKKDINSHNIFEFKWKGNWYVMRTNTEMKEFISLVEYINNSNYVPKNTRYVRYLNNRNGRFIYPSIIPDFYF